MLNNMARHWLFCLPLIVFGSHYGVQNIIGYYRYPAELIDKMVLALALSVVSYGLCYRYVSVKWSAGLSRGLSIRQHQRSLCLTVVLAFLIVVLAACAQSSAVPIVEALRGAPYDRLAQLRNAFMRGSSGSSTLINYLYAIFLQALMPLALSYVFLVRDRYRYVVLSIFMLGASLSLSKGIFLCVTAPLIAIFLMTRRWGAALAAFAGLLASIAVMYVLASGFVGTKFEPIHPVPNPVVDPVTPTAQTALQSDVPDHYNLFTEKNQALLIINRIVWIPYVTAVDWFRYQDIHMQEGYLLGRSIRPLAYLLGTERFYLEKEVAELQWGGPSGATSNAVFFADAWLNWGALGVVVYSTLLALTIKLIMASNNLALIAASGFPVWVACFSALPPVYLSAGLGFLLLFAFMLRIEERADMSVVVGVQHYSARA